MYLETIRLLFLEAKYKKAQGSLEYIMMLAAASIVILIALTMIVKVKDVVLPHFASGNSSIINQIDNQLNQLSNST